MCAQTDVYISTVGCPLNDKGGGRALRLHLSSVVFSIDGNRHPLHEHALKRTTGLGQLCLECFLLHMVENKYFTT